MLLKSFFRAPSNKPELPRKHYTCSCGVKFSIKPSKDTFFHSNDIVCPSCKKKDYKKPLADKLADAYEIMKLDVIKYNK